MGDVVWLVEFVVMVFVLCMIELVLLGGWLVEVEKMVVLVCDCGVVMCVIGNCESVCMFVFLVGVK